MLKIQFINNYQYSIPITIAIVQQSGYLGNWSKHHMFFRRSNVSIENCKY